MIETGDRLRACQQSLKSRRSLAAWGTAWIDNNLNQRQKIPFATRRFRYLTGMQISLDAAHGINLIRAYSDREIQINERRFTKSVIVTADRIIDDAPLESVQTLSVQTIDAILALQPEVVLLGTGARMEFASMELTRRFAAAQIGFEAMATAAACRTYNVLVSEQRRVLAILML
jgi:uncharacterized protein